MKIQKINDERVILKNLQNVRIAYALQTLGIVGILGYDYITKGMDGMKENPLWIIFIISTAILAFLSMGISVEHESDRSSPKKGLVISLIVLLSICMAIGFFTSISEGIIEGVLTGEIFLICGLAFFLFLFVIRNRHRNENFDDE